MSDNCFIFCLREQNEIYLNQKRPSQTHVSKPNVLYTDSVYGHVPMNDMSDSVKHPVLKTTMSNSQLNKKEKVNTNTCFYT